MADIKERLISIFPVCHVYEVVVSDNINCTYVAKFGGTSLSDAVHFKRVKQIVTEYEGRCFVVPSAPGKRFASDTKVTDLLYTLYSQKEDFDTAKETASIIENRFLEIANGLKITKEQFDISGYFEKLLQELPNSNEDYIASRGEYLCGRLLSIYLGYEFIDPADLILFDEYKELIMKKTLRAIARHTKSIDRAVIPGFYGKNIVTGETTTFSRGGSDITGALVARGVNAVVYDNWTDVSGFFTADPRIVKEAARVPALNFSELRELSCMGASVLHSSTVLPLMDSNIPIRVRNTFDLRSKGTLIAPNDYKSASSKPKVAGIAGKKGFTSVIISKLSLGESRSFVRLALHAFEACSIPVEHIPLSMDNLSVVTFTAALKNKKKMLHDELQRVLGDISVDFCDGLSLVAAVSSSLSTNAVFARVMFDALAKADISIRLTDQGSGANSLVIGVDEHRFDDAIRAIYEAFIEHDFI